MLTDAEKQDVAEQVHFACNGHELGLHVEFYEWVDGEHVALYDEWLDCKHDFLITEGPAYVYVGEVD